MSWIDLVFVIILTAFIINGLIQGLVRQLASLLGFVLGLALALIFYRGLAGLLTSSSAAALALAPIAFVMILLATWGLGALAGLLLRRKARTEEKDWQDDLGGALLGLVSGLLVLAIFVAGVSQADSALSQQLRDSRLTGWLVDVTWAVLSRLPLKCAPCGEETRVSHAAQQARSFLHCFGAPDAPHFRRGGGAPGHAHRAAS